MKPTRYILLSILTVTTVFLTTGCIPMLMGPMMMGTTGSHSDNMQGMMKCGGMMGGMKCSGKQPNMKCGSGSDTSKNRSFDHNRTKKKLR